MSEEAETEGAWVGCCLQGHRGRDSFRTPVQLYPSLKPAPWWIIVTRLWRAAFQVWEGTFSTTTNIGWDLCGSDPDTKLRSVPPGPAANITQTPLQLRRQDLHTLSQKIQTELSDETHGSSKNGWSGGAEESGMSPRSWARSLGGGGFEMRRKYGGIWKCKELLNTHLPTQYSQMFSVC